MDNNSIEMMEEYMPDSQFESEYDEDDVKREASRRSRRHRVRENSWVRKRLHKKKMFRKFLSANTAMTKDTWDTACTLRGVWGTELSTNGGCYFINPYTHVYMKHSGQLVQYSGIMEKIGDFISFEKKDRTKSSITNRRIRHLPVSDDNCMRYSYYKKCMYREHKEDDMW